MRVLSSCIALHKALSEPIEVIWERNKELNCSFSDLFEPIEGIKIIEWNFLYRFQKLAKQRRLKELESIMLGADVRLNDIEVREMRHMRTDLLDLIKNAGSVFINTCERFYGDNETVREIKACDKIVKQLREHKLESSYLGVHVRLTDSELSVKYSPLDLFRESLQTYFKMKPESKVLLCTDDDKVVETLREDFGNKIMNIPSVKDRSKSKAIQAALVDLLLLSRSEKIIGSYWSSFSEEAANYGGIELEVLKIND